MVLHFRSALNHYDTYIPYFLKELGLGFSQRQTGILYWARERAHITPWFEERLDRRMFCFGKYKATFGYFELIYYPMFDFS